MGCFSELWYGFCSGINRMYQFWWNVVEACRGVPERTAVNVRQLLYRYFKHWLLDKQNDRGLRDTMLDQARVQTKSPKDTSLGNRRSGWPSQCIYLSHATIDSRYIWSKLASLRTLYPDLRWCTWINIYLWQTLITIFVLCINHVTSHAKIVSRLHLELCNPKPTSASLTQIPMTQKNPSLNIVPIGGAYGPPDKSPCVVFIGHTVCASVSRCADRNRILHPALFYILSTLCAYIVSIFFRFMCAISSLAVTTWCVHQYVAK